MTPQTLVRPSAQASVSRHFDPLDFDEHFGVLSPENLVVVRPYRGDDDDQVLEELRPKYIVMYDTDPGFIRRVEVSLPAAFRSVTGADALRSGICAGLSKLKSWLGRACVLYDVCGLCGGAAVSKRAEEGDGVLQAVDQGEGGQSSFLIRTRSLSRCLLTTAVCVSTQTMLIPLSGDPRGRPADSTNTQATLAKVISTRLAGGAAAAAEETEPSTVRPSSSS